MVGHNARAEGGLLVAEPLPLLRQDGARLVGHGHWHVMLDAAIWLRVYPLPSPLAQLVHGLYSPIRLAQVVCERSYCAVLRVPPSSHRAAAEQPLSSQPEPGLSFGSFGTLYIL
jgi:hypothetical protein